MSSSDSESFSESETPVIPKNIIKDESSDESSSENEISVKKNIKETKEDKKDFFMDKLKEYIKIDDLLKEKTELTKQKKNLEKFILDYMAKNKMSTVTVSNDTINRIEKEVKASIDMEKLPTIALDMMKKDKYAKSDGTIPSGVEGLKIIECVLDAMENRPTKKVIKLERKGTGKSKKTVKSK
jgi:hypothetical protein